MRINKERDIFLVIKKVADKQLNNTLKGKCLFLCYQPTIPKKLVEKTKN